MTVQLLLLQNIFHTEMAPQIKPCQNSPLRTYVPQKKDAVCISAGLRRDADSSSRVQRQQRPQRLRWPKGMWKEGRMEGGLVELCLGGWDRRAEKVREDLGGQERENTA